MESKPEPSIQSMSFIPIESVKSVVKISELAGSVSYPQPGSGGAPWFELRFALPDFSLPGILPP
jgi:hypothetical protein